MPQAALRAISLRNSRRDAMCVTSYVAMVRAARPRGVQPLRHPTASGQCEVLGNAASLDGCDCPVALWRQAGAGRHMNAAWLWRGRREINAERSIERIQSAA